MNKKQSMNFYNQADMVNMNGDVYPKEVLEKAFEEFGATVERGERNLIYLNSSDKVVGEVIEVQPDMIEIAVFDEELLNRPLLTSISSKIKGD